MRIEKVTANKQIAEEWLSRNMERNRMVSPQLVRSYANDMRAGRWRRNSETIKFSRAGYLIDGQHRLMAIADADITIDLDVAYDVPDDAVHTIDLGRSRSTADILHMDGYSTPKILSGGAKMVMNYLDDVAPTYTRTPPAVKQFIGEFPGVQEYANKVSMLHGLIPPSPVAGVLYLASVDGSRRKQIEDFLTGLKSGANLADGDPRLTLRDAIAAARAKAGTGSKALDPSYVFVITARAWNAFAEHRPITIARYARTRKTKRLILPHITGGPRPGSGAAGLRSMVTATLNRRVLDANRA